MRRRVTIKEINYLPLNRNQFSEGIVDINRQ